MQIRDEQYRAVGQPCRNFNILGSTIIIDPVDQREKVVLSNFAAGATGNLILIDPAMGAGETIMLPADDGAWALLNLNNETLLVGTCPNSGYLHRLDLATRRWAEGLRCPSESYIWNLCQGDDGLVYGGTYPGCLLLQYDPQAHTLTDVGRMSPDLANLYSRFVYAVPGHILVECWSAAHHLTLYAVATGESRPFGRVGAKVERITEQYLCTVAETEHGPKQDFYDLQTLSAQLPQPLPPESAPPYPGVRHFQQLRDGRWFGVRGQEYFLMQPSERQPTLHAIPAERPPTRIHTITPAPNGWIWGSCGFGQTIFSCDPASDAAVPASDAAVPASDAATPASDAHWNSNGVCDSGGEVYGMAFAGEKLYLSAYAGGDHIVYAPDKPWDQVNNINPRTLASVAPALIRPEANSVIGPDGHFWTGWMARYGRYGGGLSRVDTTTGEVRCWSDPIPGQPLMHLATDDRYLYFVTGGAGNGLPAKVEPFHLVAWDPVAADDSADAAMIWQHRFAAGERLGPLCAVGGELLVVVDETLHRLELTPLPGQPSWGAKLALPAPCTALLTLPDQRALLFCAGGVWQYTVGTDELHPISTLPGTVRTAARTPDGSVYFACGTTLYQLQHKF